jgi:hypothetical protein
LSLSCNAILYKVDNWSFVDYVSLNGQYLI